MIFQTRSNKAKEVIDNIIKRLNIKFETDKFQIYYFMFETDNLRTRYVVIEEKIKQFINQLNLGQSLSTTELIPIWQNNLFHNAIDILSVKMLVRSGSMNLFLD